MKKKAIALLEASGIEVLNGKIRKSSLASAKKILAGEEFLNLDNIGFEVDDFDDFLKDLNIEPVFRWFYEDASPDGLEGFELGLKYSENDVALVLYEEIQYYIRKSDLKKIQDKL